MRVTRDNENRKTGGQRGNNLMQSIGRLPGVVPVTSAVFCMLDSETPWQVKGAGVFAVLYLMMPIDLIPDFLIIILGLGVLDDAAVVYMAYNYAKSHIRPSHRQQALEFFSLSESNDTV